MRLPDSLRYAWLRDRRYAAGIFQAQLVRDHSKDVYWCPTGCPGIIARLEGGHAEKRTQLSGMRPFPLKHDMIRIHTRRLVNNSVTEGTEHDEILECASRFLA